MLRQVAHEQIKKNKHKQIQTHKNLRKNLIMIKIKSISVLINIILNMGYDSYLV